MNRFRNWLVRFMSGRYGSDALGKFTMITYLSRNIVARSRENRRFLSIKNGIKKFFWLRKQMWKDRKTHVYKKCPHCKSVLRLPRRKGDHGVTCPKCKKVFRVKI